MILKINEGTLQEDSVEIGSQIHNYSSFYENKFARIKKWREDMGKTDRNEQNQKRETNMMYKKAIKS